MLCFNARYINIVLTTFACFAPYRIAQLTGVTTVGSTILTFSTGVKSNRVLEAPSVHIQGSTMNLFWSDNACVYNRHPREVREESRNKVTDAGICIRIQSLHQTTTSSARIFPRQAILSKVSQLRDTYVLRSLQKVHRLNVPALFRFLGSEFLSNLHQNQNSFFVFCQWSVWSRVGWHFHWSRRVRIYATQ